jgi:hypothetical protein
MSTFNRETGRHEVPEDRNPAARMELLRHLGLDKDRPIPELDVLARALAQDASSLVGRPDGFFSFVNIMQAGGYQYFAGMYVPADPGVGGPVAAAAEIQPADRYMPRSEGWCVHTVDRRLALPLENIYDMPRWSGNGAVAKLGANTYIGAPLIDQQTEIAFGTVAVVGRRPAAWGREGVALIKDYAAKALDLIYDPAHQTAR